MIRNVAGQKISAVLLRKTDGSDVNSGDTKVYVTIDGGTQVLGAGTVECEGHGVWTYNPTKAETNGSYISFAFVNPLAITANRSVYTTIGPPEISAPGDAGILALTSQQIINYALNEIGFLAPGEEASTANSVYALSLLNSLLDSWNTQKRYIYHIEHEEFAITQSKQSYTIGPANADFIVSARPAWIERCNLIVDDARTPLAVINYEQYADIPVPALASTMPTQIYYQASWPNGRIWPYPYPSGGQIKLELFTANQLTHFTSLGQTVSFPQGYRLAIIHSLAERLCLAFGRPIPPELREFAREARMNIANVNVKAPSQTSDLQFIGGNGGLYWDARIRGWRG